MSTQKVSLHCDTCSKSLNIHHSKVKAGLSIVCEACQTGMMFGPQSAAPEARKALRLARKLRLSMAGVQ
jgi:uncharacterized Zn finger protein